MATAAAAAAPLLPMIISRVEIKERRAGTSTLVCRLPPPLLDTAMVAAEAAALPSPPPLKSFNLLSNSA